VDGIAAVVREEEVHGANDFEAVVAGAMFRVAQCGGDGAGAVHGVLPVLFEHQFREVPSLPTVIHHTLRPGPFPVAELGSFQQKPGKTDVTGRTGMADFGAISD